MFGLSIIYSLIYLRLLRTLVSLKAGFGVWFLFFKFLVLFFPLPLPTEPGSRGPRLTSVGEGRRDRDKGGGKRMWRAILNSAIRNQNRRVGLNSAIRNQNRNSWQEAMWKAGLQLDAKIARQHWKITDSITRWSETPDILSPRPDLALHADKKCARPEAFPLSMEFSRPEYHSLL